MGGSELEPLLQGFGLAVPRGDRSLHLGALTMNTEEEVRLAIFMICDSEAAVAISLRAEQDPFCVSIFSLSQLIGRSLVYLSGKHVTLCETPILRAFHNVNRELDLHLVNDRTPHFLLVRFGHLGRRHPKVPQCGKITMQIEGDVLCKRSDLTVRGRVDWKGEVFLDNDTSP
jgi:hypothetical protein